MGIAESDSQSEPSSAPGTVTLFARRAKRISEADVFAAADVLLIEGHRPTIDRVRMKLGRGSPNTINDHLDAWWSKLGARLRDIPGREFPQLPERVSAALQSLWNAALEGAHEALQASQTDREHRVSEQERALQARSQALDEREQSIEARARSVEESLSFAREQLNSGQRRIDELERAARTQLTDAEHHRARIAELEAAVMELRDTADRTRATYEAERARMEERHTATEAHWLGEVDRARQEAKGAAKESERVSRDLRARIEQLGREREALREDLLESRAQLKTAAAVREQLEGRLEALEKLGIDSSPKMKRPRPTNTQPTARRNKRSVARK
jgi:chromosome segregation ATPase